MAWIESHAELRDHPKVDDLMDLLSITRRDAVGLLHMVWWRALTYAPSGDLSTTRDAAIARWCDWDGDPEHLVNALTEAGFLDAERRLHDWQDYAGRWIDRREANATRKRESRARPVRGTYTGRPPDVTQMSGATGPNRTLTGPDLNRTGPDTPIASQCPPAEPEDGADAPPKPKRETFSSSGDCATMAASDSREPPMPQGREAAIGSAGQGATPSDSRAPHEAASGSTAPGNPPAKPKPPKRTRVKTAPPDSLTPTETEYRLGEELGLSRAQVDRSAEAMLDHWRAEGEIRADWLASLRTWLRRGVIFDQPRASPNHRNGTARPPPNSKIPTDASEYLQSPFGPIPRR